jgi:bromodomain-containing protein 8
LSIFFADETQSPHDEPAMPEAKALRKTRSATNAIMTETTTRQFKNKMNQLHQEVLGHKHGPIFNAAVRAVSRTVGHCNYCGVLILSLKSDAPGYYDVVKRPMDLKKIKANIKNGTIRNIDDFQHDLYLMFW